MSVMAVAEDMVMGVTDKIRRERQQGDAICGAIFPRDFRDEVSQRKPLSL